MEKPNSLKEKYLFCKKKAVRDFPLFLAFEIPRLLFSPLSDFLIFQFASNNIWNITTKMRKKKREEQLRVLFISFLFWKCNGCLCFGRSSRWKIKSQVCLI